MTIRMTLNIFPLAILCLSVGSLGNIFSRRQTGGSAVETHTPPCAFCFSPAPAS